MSDERILLRSSEQADVLMDLGRYEEAFKQLQTALRLDPENAYLLIQLCRVFLGMDRQQQAREAAEKAVALEPEWDGAHRYLAHVQYHQRDYQTALTHSEAAVGIDPQSAGNLLIHAQCLSALGRYRKAFQSANEALNLEPEDERCQRLLGDLCVELAMYKKAEKYYRHGLGKSPDDAYLHFCLGNCLYLQDRFVEAAQFLMNAVKMEPGEPVYKERLMSTVKDYVNRGIATENEKRLGKFPTVVRQFYQYESGRLTRFQRLGVYQLVIIWTLVLSGLVILSNFFSQ